MKTPQEIIDKKLALHYVFSDDNTQQELDDFKNAVLEAMTEYGNQMWNTALDYALKYHKLKNTQKMMRANSTDAYMVGGI